MKTSHLSIHTPVVVGGGRAVYHPVSASAEMATVLPHLPVFSSAMSLKQHVLMAPKSRHEVVDSCKNSTVQSPEGQGYPMFFFKKGWIFVIVAVIVCVVGFIFGRSQAPDVPVTIYKPVETTQRTTVRRVQDTTTETDKHASQTPYTPQGVKSESEEVVLDAPESEDVNSLSVEREGEITSGVVAAPDNAKGEVPPELSSEAMEELHREAAFDTRIREIQSELSTFANRDISNEEFLHVIELQEELLSIQKERGLLHQEGGDVSATFDHLKFTAQHMTEDGRFPTRHGHRLLEGLRSTGPDSPEKQQAVEHLTRVLNIAIENGDEYFKLDPAGQ